MDEFHRGPYRTAVGPAEMLTEIRVPLHDRTRAAPTRRSSGASATGPSRPPASRCTLRDGTIERAGVALAAVGASMRATAAERELQGHPPSMPLFQHAAAIAAEHCTPVTDQRGSQEYKRHVVGVLTERALRRAAQRATRGGVTWR